jgi:hypothetical protein
MIPDSITEYKNTGFLDNDLLVSYLGKNNLLKLPQSGRIVIISGPPASGGLRNISPPELFIVKYSLILFIRTQRRRKLLREAKQFPTEQREF